MHGAENAERRGTWVLTVLLNSLHEQFLMLSASCESDYDHYSNLACIMHTWEGLRARAHAQASASVITPSQCIGSLYVYIYTCIDLY